MDLTQFVKLVEQSSLLDSALTAQAVELCFARAKAKGKRTLTYEGFLKALACVAGEKRTTIGGVVKTMLAAPAIPLATADTLTRVTLDRRPSSLQLQDTLGNEELVPPAPRPAPPQHPGSLCSTVPDARLSGSLAHETHTWTLAIVQHLSRRCRSSMIAPGYS
eukprot:2532016-Pyramimonas_sp.AAC.2